MTGRDYLEEEQRKYLKKMNEQEEQACLNKLWAGMSCKEHCAYYATLKCRHPERVFPKRRY